MKIISFNLRYGSANDGPNNWSNRKDIVIETINSLKPHLMGTQECMPFQSDDIKSSIHYLNDFGLGRYHSVPTKERPQESYSGEHCSIFYDFRYLELKECGTFWHSDTPEIPGSVSWENAQARITTWGIFETIKERKKFIYFNTHLAANLVLSDPYTKKTTDLHIDRIRGLSGNLPRLLTGDFNLNPGTEPHIRLTDTGPESPGMKDTWIMLNKPEKDGYTTHNFDGKPKKERIDWILASPQFKPQSMEVVVFNRNGRYPSDHFPVVAELDLK